MTGMNTYTSRPTISSRNLQPKFQLGKNLQLLIQLTVHGQFKVNLVVQSSGRRGWGCLSFVLLGKWY